MEPVIVSIVGWVVTELVPDHVEVTTPLTTRLRARFELSANICKLVLVNKEKDNKLFRNRFFITSPVFCLLFQIKTGFIFSLQFYTL